MPPPPPTSTPANSVLEGPLSLAVALFTPACNGGYGIPQQGTSGSQTRGLARWGDYSSLNVDPTDDCTFWYTTEYVKTNGTYNWSTRITSCRLPSCTGNVAVAVP